MQLTDDCSSRSRQVRRRALRRHVAAPAVQPKLVGQGARLLRPFQLLLSSLLNSLLSSRSSFQKDLGTSAKGQNDSDMILILSLKYTDKLK